MEQRQFTQVEDLIQTVLILRISKALCGQGVRGILTLDIWKVGKFLSLTNTVL